MPIYIKKKLVFFIMMMSVTMTRMLVIVLFLPPNFLPSDPYPTNCHLSGIR